jgi:hypothetical protein
LRILGSALLFACQALKVRRFVGGWLPLFFIKHDQRFNRNWLVGKVAISEINQEFIGFARFTYRNASGETFKSSATCSATSARVLHLKSWNGMKSL